MNSGLGHHLCRYGSQPSMQTVNIQNQDPTFDTTIVLGTPIGSLMLSEAASIFVQPRLHSHGRWWGRAIPRHALFQKTAGQQICHSDRSFAALPLPPT